MAKDAHIPTLSAVSDPPESGAPVLGDLDTLFFQYSRYVAHIAYRIVGDPSDTEDIVQDVFLDAHTGLRRRDNAQEIKGWLALVTTRSAMRLLKRRALKRKLGLLDPPDYYEMEDSAASPEDATILKAVFRKLDQLPVNDRIAWTLKTLQGHNLEECARLTGWSRSTLHRRVMSANAALKGFVDG